MNATKFVVLLLIGVLCANVGARKLEGVSEDTKLSTSLPKTSTEGVGAALSVTNNQYDYVFDSSGASASGAPPGSSATGYASHSSGTSVYINADGPNAEATTTGGGSGQATAGAAASPSGAVGSGTSSGGTGSSGNGRIDND